jgi:signal transduction histidine kinase
LSRRAARQGAYLFGLAGALGVTAIATEPGRAALLAGIALADFFITALCLLLPWERWPVSRVAWLGLGAFAVLAVSTWAFNGYTGGTIPFYVLTFTWLGLHQSPRVVLLAGVPATVSYAGGLVAAQAPPNVIGSTVVLIPVVVAVGLVISRQVRSLRDSQRRLQTQERWRAAMVATLAHDIRSPLSSITGALELLTDDEGTPPRLLPLVQAAARQTQRLTQLAGSLLDLERVEQGKLRLDITEFDVRELALEVARLSPPDRVTVDITSPLTLRADRARIEQVLVNLMNNAVRHGQGHVVIGARDGDGAVVLTVRDHGPGVSAENAPKLFTRLAHGRAGTESVGLGLWIVRMLAEAHGGTVWQENVKPGALFGVRIPQT